MKLIYMFSECNLTHHVLYYICITSALLRYDIQNSWYRTDLVQMPQPPQLTDFNVEEEWLWSECSVVQAPDIISK